MPTDLIRLWALFPHSNYTIVGNLIYSNETELLARYVYSVAETSLPPHIVTAIRYKLAAEFSVSITESVSKSEYYERKYMRAAQIARSIDSQSKPPVSIIDSPFVDVRFSGSYSGGYFL